MKNFETLEVGKTYKNKTGKLVKIINQGKDDKYPYYSKDESYTKTGIYLIGFKHEQDLIELIEDMPTLDPNPQDAKPLTICEIDAKIAELQELRKELDKSVEVSDNSWGDIISVRSYGKYKEKGFRLSSRYNWQIVKDSMGELVLVPTKK